MGGAGTTLPTGDKGEDRTFQLPREPLILKPPTPHFQLCPTLVAHPAVLLSANNWLCSGISPGGAQGTICGAGNKRRLAACKASALPAVPAPPSSLLGTLASAGGVVTALLSVPLSKAKGRSMEGGNRWVLFQHKHWE